MWLLLLFAFLSGFVTVLSPCVLPVLPAILSVGTDQSRFRPLGVVIGLVVSFIFFTLLLKTLVSLTGLSGDALRYLAIGIISLFGIILLFPKLSDYFATKTAWIADLGSALQGKSNAKGGFFSGFILGSALGLVWTPCAGPILAAVIAIAASSTITKEVVLITAAYALGSAIPLLLIILGSQSLIRSSKFLTRYLERIRQFFGAVMILTAIALYNHWEVKLQELTLKYLPWINVENVSSVNQALDQLRLRSGQSNELVQKMPPFKGIVHWINSPPLTPEMLNGKVTLIDFWTYSCINCIRTFPYLKQWDQEYRDKGLVIVGVHTPEFEFEKNIKNVEEAVNRFEIKYPVAMDNDYATWNAYNNRYWPAHYLFDQAGNLVQAHFGEGAYLETENAIRELLGMSPITKEKEQMKASRPLTPETYLGYKRAQNYQQKVTRGTEQEYQQTEALGDDQVALKGTWKVNEEFIESESNNSELLLNFIATRVYLVMESEKPAEVMIELDGKPLEKKYYTTDMNNSGQILVHDARKYDVVNLNMNYGRHLLTLKIPKNVRLYAFTFGYEP